MLVDRLAVIMLSGRKLRPFLLMDGCCSVAGSDMCVGMLERFLGTAVCKEECFERQFINTSAVQREAGITFQNSASLLWILSSHNFYLKTGMF